MNTVLEQDIVVKSNVLQPEDLEYIAYTGQHDLAHGIFRSLDRNVQRSYLNKYVFQSVMLGGIDKLRKYLSSSAEVEANEEKDFLDRTMLEFLDRARVERVFPRELFESSLVWCEELTRLSLLTEALRTYEEVLGMGARRYPDLYARLISGKADVLSTMGRLNEAESLLQTLINRPYILSNRNFIPKVMFALAKVSALRGDLQTYTSLMFRGLRLFYTDMERRETFFEHIRNMYRHSYKVVLDSRRTLMEKLLFAAHWLCFRVERNRFTRTLRVNRGFRLMLLGWLYYLSFVRKRETPAVQSRRAAEEVMLLPLKRNGNGIPARSGNSRNILVTRAMGGIGDLLMMTPGLHELKNRYPDSEIHLAIPRRYFPLFEGNHDVILVDIDERTIEPHAYSKWFNLSECPAARIESRTAPRVRKNRIEIFARALGNSRRCVRSMMKKPRYFLSLKDREFQNEFWERNGLHGKSVIGVQLHSEESYRNYPFMSDVIRALAGRFTVLVFDGDKVTESFGPHSIVVGGLALREAFALAAGCDAILCPDSAFVHLAAALDIPCVALYGPIDGAVRTRDYPLCTYLDARGNLPCLPCWRNESIACRLTDMRMSVCMASILVSRVQHTIEHVLTWRN
jgi:ADP-heptose:LPS heptosyltransferase